jgi:hypothetical protein
MRWRPAIALALCSVAQGLHAAGQQPLWSQAWRPDLGFWDDGPTCLLSPPEGISPAGFDLSFSWNARHGTVLWIDWRTNNTPAVRIESEGTDDSWSLTLEPWDSRYNGRQALLDSRVAGGILRNLELGHALTVVLSLDGAESQRYHVPARGPQIGAPMFQACIQSVIDDPPRYLFDPGRPFMGSYKAGERCEFTQIIKLQSIPLSVTLFADTDGEGGGIRFERPMSSHDPHGPLHTRETPDRVEAQPLFGPAFDLVEDFGYDITAGQLDELGAGLLRGQMRKFSLTTPQGRHSTLTFGGKLGKPFAAMFAACRQARKITQESKSP